MAFLDRSQIVRTADRAPPAPGKELMIGILLAALLATLAIRNLMPADAPDYLKELFCSNTRALLEILAAENCKAR